MKAFIILNTQLFKDTKPLKGYETIYVVEDPYYINNYAHKQKMVVYIASLRYYYDYLTQKLSNAKIEYLQSHEYNKIAKLMKHYSEVHMYDPIDQPLIAKYSSPITTFYSSLLFLETKKDLIEYKNTCKKESTYSNSSFYKWQRKRLKILIDGDKPIGGKWSFDSDNRKKFPKDYEEQAIKTYNNKYIQFAIDYVKKHFTENIGLIDNIYYPITHKDAEKHFKAFIDTKLNNFGPVEDAMSSNVIFGEHSNISVLLNIGLLDIKYVLNTVMTYYYKSKNDKRILASVEGFVRQLIGWRSYMRFVYHFHRDDLMKGNYFSFTNKMPNSWYKGDTGLGVLDNLIGKVHKYAYLHHIERLMVVGNLSLLLEIHPKYVYAWFTTMFIDSNSEWVMAGNVYGMLGHSSENVKIMNRFYICSDNYIKKMSNYKKDELIGISDAYKRFLKKYRSKLKSDYMLASQLARI